MADVCEMCGQELTNDCVGREHDSYDCCTHLRSRIRALEAELAELRKRDDDIESLSRAFNDMNDGCVALEKENSEHCVAFQAIAAELGILDELPDQARVLAVICELRKRDEDVRTLDEWAWVPLRNRYWFVDKFGDAAFVCQLRAGEGDHQFEGATPDEARAAAAHAARKA